MLQRAVIAGVIGRRYYEPGETFEHAERMNWAAPVVPAEAAASVEVAAPVDKPTAPAARKKKEAAASNDAGPDADLI